ncbi:uncharacterized protein DS421_12g372090 [Arachis hypogaea]|nr:uncharacterized protein DS421_12g372090 [Arachis hypogaea]
MARFLPLKARFQEELQDLPYQEKKKTASIRKEDLNSKSSFPFLFIKKKDSRRATHRKKQKWKARSYLGSEVHQGSESFLGVKVKIKGSDGRNLMRRVERGICMLILFRFSLSLLFVRTAATLGWRKSCLVESVSTLEASPSILRVNGQGLRSRRESKSTEFS